MHASHASQLHCRSVGNFGRLRVGIEAESVPVNISFHPSTGWTAIPPCSGRNTHGEGCMQGYGAVALPPRDRCLHPSTRYRAPAWQWNRDNAILQPGRRSLRAPGPRFRSHRGIQRGRFGCGVAKSGVNSGGYGSTAWSPVVGAYGTASCLDAVLPAEPTRYTTSPTSVPCSAWMQFAPPIRIFLSLGLPAVGPPPRFTGT